MNKDLSEIKALTFDTGGTVLDWHSGFRDAFATAGQRHNVIRDWAELANELRRKSLELMWALEPEQVPVYTFDNAHRDALNAMLKEHGLEMFDQDDVRKISYDAVHNWKAWPEVSKAIDRLRDRFLCVPLTVLSYRIVLDTARRNQLNWDTVFACQGIGAMKPDKTVYNSGAHYLQLKPSECLMVACHNFDLNAAAEVGFKTAFIRRPNEWGGAPSPELKANFEREIIANDFDDLADQLIESAVLK